MNTPATGSTPKARAAKKAPTNSSNKVPMGARRSKTVNRVAAHKGAGTVGVMHSTRAVLLNEIWGLIAEDSSGVEEAKTGSLQLMEYFQKAGQGFTLSSPLAHKLIMRGISPKTISPLSSVLGVGLSNVTSYLDIDRGTPARQESKGQPLPRHAAEGVLRLLEIERMAFDTFEEEDSREWLNRPHPMLDGETPLEAAGTSYGAERVKGILVAIKYGGVA